MVELAKYPFDFSEILQATTQKIKDVNVNLKVYFNFQWNKTKRFSQSNTELVKKN